MQNAVAGASVTLVHYNVYNFTVTSLKLALAGAI
jgi:hypothetical protein